MVEYLIMIEERRKKYWDKLLNKKVLKKIIGLINNING